MVACEKNICNAWIGTVWLGIGVKKASLGEAYRFTSAKLNYGFDSTNSARRFFSQADSSLPVTAGRSSP